MTAASSASASAERALLRVSLASTEPGPLGFVIAVVLAALISMGTFAHADRHGSAHATAWGIGAFLAAGIVVPVYFVRYWVRKRRVRDE